MAEEEKNLPGEDASAQPQNEEKAKTPWQIQKETWYDKIPLSLKQLDWIIGICLVLLALCFIAIILDAAGIYNFFG
ncbi:MAG: hypothetical protein UEP57_10275 [Oscillospiraceae bacterium]|nr:hypothetical protein [Oscillospiraceae bacterium]